MEILINVQLKKGKYDLHVIAFRWVENDPSRKNSPKMAAIGDDLIRRLVMVVGLVLDIFNVNMIIAIIAIAPLVGSQIWLKPND